MTLNEELRQSQRPSESSGSSLLRFCALAYRSQELGEPTPVFLIVLEDSKQGLRFLVDPDWRGLVHEGDVEHIESLLSDFLERAKEQPEALFKQLSSLDVGALVTQETGEQISDRPALLELSSRFVRL